MTKGKCRSKKQQRDFVVVEETIVRSINTEKSGEYYIIENATLRLPQKIATRHPLGVSG